MKKINLIIFTIILFLIFSFNAKALSNGVYIIHSSIDNNFVLDATGGNTKNGTNIQLFQSNGTKAQKWSITNLENGYYMITSLVSPSQNFDVAGGGKTNGTNLQLHQNNGTKAQEWLIKETGDGYYYLMSNCNGLYLDVDTARMQNGTNIQLWKGLQNPAQKFKLTRDYSAEHTIDEGTYIIRSSINSNFVLDAAGGSVKNGTNIQLFQSNGTKAQKWKITYKENGYYSISSLLDLTQNFDVAGGGKTNGTNLQLNQNNGTRAQEWLIKETGDGYYYLMSNCNGLYLDIDTARMQNGTNIQLWKGLQNPAQKFKLEKFYESEKTLEDGIYTIHSSINNNFVLDAARGIAQNGTNIQLFQSNGTKAQKWKITYKENGYYNISSLLDLTQNFDVAGGGKTNGTNLQLHQNNETKAQEWIIKETGDGYYYLMSNCNGLYLDVDTARMQNGTNIQLWKGLQNPAQKFKFIKAEQKTRVIDVSYHQGQIDWNKVYNTGIYGVMLRIGYWNTEDGRLSEYISEVKRLGIPYGIYIFSYANTTNGANIEADFTKSIISKYNLNPTLGIYYDLEDWYISADNTSNSLSKDQYDNIARTYINSVSNYVGSKYKVKIYADLNHVNNRFGGYARSESDWIAHYDVSECGYKGPHSLWQYTSSGTIDGIRGYVDLNYLY